MLSPHLRYKRHWATDFGQFKPTELYRVHRIMQSAANKHRIAKSILVHGASPGLMFRWWKVVGLPHAAKALTPVDRMSIELAGTALAADEMKSISHLIIVAKRFHHD